MAWGRVVYEVVTEKELENFNLDDIISKTSSEKGLEYKLQTVSPADGKHKLDLKVK